MLLHDDEIPVDEGTVRSLLREQRPEWADLPVGPAGSGTDNTMFRLGDELLVRLPRTPDKATAVRKEQTWLPRLAPHLPCRVPEPVHAGRPGPAFPTVWSVYRWIDGDEVGPGSVTDWARFGVDLAAFVRSLRAVDLMGARREGELSGYRGGPLREYAWITESFDDCRRLPDPDLDIDVLHRIWSDSLALPGSTAPVGWLHGDLKPTNLLARGGRLHAAIDFGGLSVGLPDAEHSPVWDLPAEARQSYWDALDLDEPTWLRARGWAVAVGVSGVAYYRDSYPAFVAECRARLRAILGDAAERGR
ncbi:aminoglycoside phosphotransferase family protein [Micromonospora auratinigra]|uniref:Predicted kinase, aminoglycoside phosphotransferase (APT) family n=1 Tax=Micromonospora auratinigra TaxID=261654 RepID=A0A1A8ZNN2_9ACTN|nr:aminoglycoside phosphotransferase family protein [Micromonospora auratinigra]SBT45427.1 Predicted kinase, aminoglycoside phosphotransferase (APT) family [Micromonospora auratinigra]